MFCFGLAVVLVGMVGGAFLDGRRRQRRAYWLSWLTGGAIMMFADHLNGGSGLMIGALLAVMSVMIAFFKSPYLKIGNRIYAVSLEDRRPDPPADGEPAEPPAPLPTDRYGTLSAATFWWLMAAMHAAVALVVVYEGWTTRQVLLIAAFAVLIGMTGFGDSARGFTRVRGRYAPGAVFLIASIPLFGAPPLLYLLGYELGRHFPQQVTHGAANNARKAL
jgi:uncharacterized membrane protein YhaH (DUF805 family)